MFVRTNNITNVSNFTVAVQEKRDILGVREESLIDLRWIGTSQSMLFSKQLTERETTQRG